MEQCIHRVRIPVDPRMGDAIDLKVEKKKEDEVKFYP
jgi:hypothetical protein